MVDVTVVDDKFVEFMESYRRPKRSDSPLLEACSQSVVLFSERMLGVRLYAWQVDFLTRLQDVCNEEDPFVRETLLKEFAVMTSRQIGKSTAVAIFVLWACVFNKYSGRKNTYGNTVAGVISASDSQAKKLLLEIKKYINLGDRFMLDKYSTKFPEKFFSRLIDDDAHNNMTTVTFRPWKVEDGKYLLRESLVGCVIKSYPPTSVVLGETFSILIIDEAGMTSRIDDVFYTEYAYPTGNARDAIRINISTPWESAGFFYRLVDPDGLHDTNAERLVFTVDAIKLEAPEYYSGVMKLVDKMKKDGLFDEVSRAYYCRFVKSEASYFDPKKVLEAFVPSVMLDSYRGECDMGIDFGGQVKSRTVVTITSLIGGRVTRLYHKAYPVGQDLGLLDDVEDLMKRFNIQRVIPDDCPAGDYLIRVMKDKGWVVHPMNFRADKVKKYGAFRAALNRGEVESYDDDELKIEMLALLFEHGKVSSVIHASPGERDDLIDSWVMSAYFYLVDEGSFNVYDVDDADDGPDPFL